MSNNYGSVQTQPQTDIPSKEYNSFTKYALWIAIGALVGGALLSAIWVLTGTQSDIIGRAFLTILLLTGFAFAILWDANRAYLKQQWQTVLSVIVWATLLVIGAFKIWGEFGGQQEEWERSFDSVDRFAQFVFIAIFMRLAMLHISIYWKALQRNKTVFNRIVGPITTALVGILTGLVTLPIIFELTNLDDFYWRVTVAVAILVAVGTALVPLVNALTNPKPKQPAMGYYPQAWPTYAGTTIPLPQLQDGSPDWNAYQVGLPNSVVTGQQVGEHVIPTQPGSPPPVPPVIPPVY